MEYKVTGISNLIKARMFHEFVSLALSLSDEEKNEILNRAFGDYIFWDEYPRVALGIDNGGVFLCVEFDDGTCDYPSFTGKSKIYYDNDLRIPNHVKSAVLYATSVMHLFGYPMSRRVNTYIKQGYPIAFYYSEGGWVADVIDFPDCIAGADTLEDTLKMVIEAMMLWTETCLEDNKQVPRKSNKTKPGAVMIDSNTVSVLVEKMLDNKSCV